MRKESQRERKRERERDEKGQSHRERGVGALHFTEERQRYTACKLRFRHPCDLEIMSTKQKRMSQSRDIVIAIKVYC